MAARLLRLGERIGDEAAHFVERDAEGLELRGALFFARALELIDDLQQGLELLLGTPRARSKGAPGLAVAQAHHEVAAVEAEDAQGIDQRWR